MSCADLVLHYSINGGRTRTAGTRCGRAASATATEARRYYGEYRGVVRGAKPVTSVKVWFAARNRRGRAVASAPFTYRLAQDTRNRVIVIADEDYDGVNPTYSGRHRTSEVRHDLRARAAPGRARRLGLGRLPQGVPHHLGVLSHFKAVVWYLGDNRLTQDPEDETTETYFGDQPTRPSPSGEQYLTIAVRDFLNEGGKLVDTGETATYYGALGSALGGIYYGLNGDPTADCVVTDDPFSDCLLLADDFAQYYLGRFSRSTSEEPAGFQGAARPRRHRRQIRRHRARRQPAGRGGHLPGHQLVLPPAEFPQFASGTSGTYTGGAGGPFEPVEGSWYVGGLHVDDSYMRLARTFDLTGVGAADAPTLSSQLSYDVEEDYDHVIVEAHTVGQTTGRRCPSRAG